MLGDFNSPHPFWNCTNTDKKGKELFNFISSYDLFLINGPQATYFSEQYNSFSTIDLAFAKEKLLNNLSWSLIPDRYTSDHFPILITTNIPVEKRCKRPFWKLKEESWNDFENNLELPNVDLNKSIDQNNKDFVSSIIKTAQECFRLSSFTYNPSLHKSWWDAECDIAV